MQPHKPGSLRFARRSREPSDTELCARVADGDARAFEQIVARHQARLLAYCRHTLVNPDDADDALQQSFISAYRAISAGRPPDELVPWLYAIARNSCRDIHAKRPHELELTSDLPLAGLADPVQQREDLRQLLVDLNRLPEQQRSALLLAELADMSHKSIADVVGCSEQKVRALIFQARNTLIAERSARDLDCQTVREQLAVARAGELRRGPLRRHLGSCDGCQSYALAMREQRSALALALPVIPAGYLLRNTLAHTVGAAATAAAGGAAGGAAAGSSVAATTMAKVAIVLALGAGTAVGVNAVSGSSPPPKPSTTGQSQGGSGAGGTGTKSPRSITGTTTRSFRAATPPPEPASAPPARSGRSAR